MLCRCKTMWLCAFNELFAAACFFLLLFLLCTSIWIVKVQRNDTHDALYFFLRWLPCFSSARWFNATDKIAMMDNKCALRNFVCDCFAQSSRINKLFQGAFSIWIEEKRHYYTHWLYRIVSSISHNVTVMCGWCCCRRHWHDSETRNDILIYVLASFQRKYLFS